MDEDKLFALKSRLHAEMTPLFDAVEGLDLSQRFNTDVMIDACSDGALLADLEAYVRLSTARGTAAMHILFNAVHDLARAESGDRLFVPRTKGWAVRSAL